MTKIYKHCFLILLICLSLSLIGTAQEQFILPIPGGTFAEAIHEYVIPSFEAKYNVKVLAEPSLSLQNLNKLRAEKDNPEMQIVSFDEVFAVPAVHEGLLDNLDHSRIPNLKDCPEIFLKDTDKYISQFFCYEILAYNHEYLKDPPKTWNDLLDPKYAGKMVWPDITTSHGVGMLVLMAKANGGSEDNIEPGFDFLKKLKPNVVTWWTNHDQVSRMLNLGEAWVAAWASDRAFAQMHQMGAPIKVVVPDGGLYYWRNCAGIPINLPEAKRDIAYKWLDHYISKEVQEFMAEHVLFGPVNKTVELNLPEDLVKHMMSQETLDKFMYFDLDKIATNQGEWIERFRREISD